MALVKKPADSRIYYQRGLAYYKNKEYLECIKDLFKSYECVPSSDFEDDLHYHIGIAFANLSHYEKAIDPFSKAISLNPKAHYYHERAKCFLIAEKPQLAL